MIGEVRLTTTLRCGFLPGELPESRHGLLNLAITFAEVAPHLELHGGNPKVPNSFDEGKSAPSCGGREAWTDF